MTEFSDGELSPAIRKAMDAMHSGNLTISAFRDRRGRLRYVYSNNEYVHPETVKAMLKRDLLEQCEAPEEANEQGEAHYRLKMK